MTFCCRVLGCDSALFTVRPGAAAAVRRRDRRRADGDARGAEGGASLIGAGPTGEWRTIYRLRGMPRANRRRRPTSPAMLRACQMCVKSQDFTSRKKGCVLGRQCRESVEGQAGTGDGVRQNGSSHTMTAEDDNLLELGVIDGLRREEGFAQKSY
jgi:hypothetical protein